MWLASESFACAGVTQALSCYGASEKLTHRTDFHQPCAKNIMRWSRAERRCRLPPARRRLFRNRVVHCASFVLQRFY